MSSFVDAPDHARGLCMPWVRRPRWRSALPRTIPPRAISASAIACSLDRPQRPASQQGRRSALAMWQDEGGVIAILTALALTAIVGFVGLAVDIGTWYWTTRA